METNLSVALRPRRLSQVIGQEGLSKQIRTLADHWPVAALFSGPTGNGKTTLARIVATSLQCIHVPGNYVNFGEPCDGCLNTVFDIREINASDFTGIDAMRALLKGVETYPFEPTKRRVIILDEAHGLSKDAQNCLLKAFEDERTATTLWMICTTDPRKLLETLRGRCVNFEVPGLDSVGVRELVGRACAEAYGGVLKVKGDFSSVADALIKHRMFGPRKILMVMEKFLAGATLEESLASVAQLWLPEYHAIAFAVTYKTWVDVLPLLKALDESLKKKPKTAKADAEPDVEEEDLLSRPEVARALRAVVAAFLKGAVLKGAKAQAAAEALYILSHCISANPFDTGSEFSATIGGLYRVNARMQK